MGHNDRFVKPNRGKDVAEDDRKKLKIDEFIMSDQRFTCDHGAPSGQGVNGLVREASRHDGQWNAQPIDIAAGQRLA